MKKFISVSLLVFQIFCLGLIAKANPEKSPAEILSEVKKIFSESRLLIEKSGNEETIAGLKNVVLLLGNASEQANGLFEEFSAKRKTIGAGSPRYQEYLDLEADLYVVKRGLSELRRDIEHAVHSESTMDMHYHLKKTDKSFPEIEEVLEVLTLSLQNVKQN